MDNQGDEQAIEHEHHALVVKAIRRADQALVRREHPRIAQWLSRRTAALQHLHRASVIARNNLAEGEDWQRVFEILSGLETNYRLDVLNIALDRDVWHLPGEWVEVDFSEADAAEFEQLRAQADADSESEG